MHVPNFGRWSRIVGSLSILMFGAALWATPTVSIPSTTTVPVGGSVTITGTVTTADGNVLSTTPKISLQWEYNAGTTASPSWVFITGTTPTCASNAGTTTCTSKVTLTGVASTGSNVPANNAFVTSTELNLQATDNTGVAVSATRDVLTVVPLATWVAVPTSVSALSANQQAILLANGDVLSFGYGSTALNVYVPASGWRTDTVTLSSPSLLRPSATLLADGTVLVAGGSTSTGALNTAKLFTDVGAVGSDTFVATTGNLVVARDSHAAALLANGKVILIGGNNAGLILKSTEIYNPIAKTFSAGPTLTTARSRATATTLPDGTVLVIGGQSSLSAQGALASAEIYTPSNSTTGSWKTTGSLNTARFFHTATLLPNGKVLVTGGIDANNNALASAEIYDPSTGLFTLVSASLVAARSQHTATLQSDGTVLIAGGAAGGSILASAEVYTPSTGTFAATGSLLTARNGHAAVLLQSGYTLVAGGANSATVNKETELFINPGTVAIPTATVTANTSGVASCVSGLTNDPNAIFYWTFPAASGNAFLSAYANSSSLSFSGTDPVTCRVTSGLGITTINSVTPSANANPAINSIVETYTSSTVTNSGVAAPTYNGNPYVLAGQNAVFTANVTFATTPKVAWLYYSTATNTWKPFPASTYTTPTVATPYSVFTAKGLSTISNGLKILAVAADPATVTSANATLLPSVTATLYVYTAPTIAWSSPTIATLPINSGSNAVFVANLTGTPAPDTTNANSTTTWQQCTPHSTTPVELCGTTSTGWTSVTLGGGTTVTNAAITSGIASTLTVPALQTSASVGNNGVLYRVKGSTVVASTAVDGTGAAVVPTYSTPVTLTVNASVTIGISANQTLYASDGSTHSKNATFTATVTGIDTSWDTPKVTWAYQVGSNTASGLLPGAWKAFPSSIYTAWDPITSTSVLTIKNPGILSSGLQIRAFVTNNYTAAATVGGSIVAAGTYGNTAKAVVSSAATLTVYSNPTMSIATVTTVPALNAPTTTPTSLEVNQAQASITFSVAAPPLGSTYVCTWYNSNIITKLNTGASGSANYTVGNVGAVAGGPGTNCVLTITSAVLANTGTYSASIVATSTDDTLTLTSASVPLTVTLGDWTATNNPLDVARYNALSLLLPNGDFWLAGGLNDTGALSSATVVTPTSTAPGTATQLPAGTFAAASAATLAFPTHLGGTATLLPNGNVLIAGGTYSNGYPQSDIEIFTPGVQGAAGSTATAGLSLIQPATGLSAALLQDGTTLLAGGSDGYEGIFYNTAAIYSNGAFTNTTASTLGKLVTPRAFATTSLLPDGRVLLAGGQVASTVAAGGVTNSAELFVPTASPAGFIVTKATGVNPAIASGTVTAQQSARIFHTATVIPNTYEFPNGAVVLAGGVDGGGNVLNTVELFDVYTGVFYNLSNLSAARAQHTATLLHDSAAACTTSPYSTALPSISCFHILISGGQNSTGLINTADTLTITGIGVTTTNLIATARVAPVPVSTVVSSSVLNSAADNQLFKYTTAAASTLLPNGSALVIGGQAQTLPTDTIATTATGEYFGAIEDYTDADAVSAAVDITSVLVHSHSYTLTAAGAGTNSPSARYYWTITSNTAGTAPSITSTSNAGAGGINSTVTFNTNSASGDIVTVKLVVIDEYGISKTLTQTITLTS